MNILIINGPNLNMLGIREPDTYGKQDYESLLTFLADTCQALGFSHEVFQSNHEGAIVDRIQAAYGKADGIVINPAAYTHTSVAIHDALKAVAIPTVEVHLTNIYERETFRHTSYTAPACVASFLGHGFDSYRLALEYLKEYLKA